MAVSCPPRFPEPVCSGKGSCTGPNQCTCDAGFSGAGTFDCFASGASEGLRPIDTHMPCLPGPSASSVCMAKLRVRKRLKLPKVTLSLARRTLVATLISLQFKSCMAYRRVSP